jgi:hypothetical protein
MPDRRNRRSGPHIRGASAEALVPFKHSGDWPVPKTPWLTADGLCYRATRLRDAPSSRLGFGSATMTRTTASTVAEYLNGLSP